MASKEDQQIQNVGDYDISFKLAFTRRWEMFKKQPRSQFYFAAVLLACLPGVYPFILSFYELYTSCKSGNPEYDWPKFWELKTAVSTCIVCFFLRSYIMKAFTPVFFKILRPNFTGNERAERARRAAQCAMKGLYFMAIVCIGYISMKDADFMPSVMGGSGDASKMFEGYPYMNQESYGLARGYLMIALGYHLFSLISHVTGPIRNDFMELILHHTITVTLIFNGYFANLIPISGMISLIHDIADVFVYLARVFVDTIYDKLAFFWYISLMIVFAYGRLFVYPFYLIYHSMWYNEDHADDIPGFKLMYVFLHALLGLHIYWYFLMVNIGLNYVKKGANAAKDTQHIKEFKKEKTKDE